jgi:hypothetical protein
LTEWQAFYGLEPFGYEVDMFGPAQISATLVAINSKKGAKVPQARDFYPRLEGDDGDIEGAIDFVSALAAAHQKGGGAHG